jgi:hypothetical protein
MGDQSAFVPVTNFFPDLQSNKCGSMSGFLTGIVFGTPKSARKKCANPGRVTNHALAPLARRVRQHRHIDRPGRFAR